MNAFRSSARRPARIWMTGSLAVVMAAVLGLRTQTEDEDERARRLVGASPYGIAETVQRLEAAAAQRGLPVLLRSEGREPVIVLASSAGGTPVVLGDGRPGIALALQVRASADGAVQVLVPAEAAGIAAALREVSAQAADELDALPQLVERALG